MLIDPRPYTYEYRKPRYSNPTLYTNNHSASLAISTKVYITVTPISPMTISTTAKKNSSPHLKNHKETTHNPKNTDSSNATSQK